MDLQEYRNTLERVRGGTVPAEFALEILDAAAAQLERAHGEHSLAEAMQISGRSRSWFERRLNDWRTRGLARKIGRVWLIRTAVIPPRRGSRATAFDPALTAEQIAEQLSA